MAIFKYFCILLATISLLLCLAYYLRLWPLELLVSFAPLVTCLLLLALAGCGIFVFFKHPLLDSWAIGGLALAGLLTIFSLWRSLTVLDLASITAGQTVSITFVTFNKEFSNHDYKKAASYLKSQTPSVVALQETTPDAVKQISKEAGMNYYYISDKLNTVKGTGAAIISRFPIKESKTLEIGEHSSLVRVVVSPSKNNQVAFYSLHLVGPFSPNRYSNRGHDIKAAGEQLDSEKLPAILGGDFNTTPYSPDLQKFNNLVADKFKNVATGQWPECTRYNTNPLLCLRIDHVYIPNGTSLTDTYKSSNLGSDHRALVVKVKL